MELIYVFDLIGTFVFAISGVLAAIENKFDMVGATIIGMVTAVGGGTLRDILIGETPVVWMTDMNYLIVAALALPVCYFFRTTVQKLRRSIFLFDTIGIGLFTILGLQKTLSVGLSPVVAILMGIVSAVFGGILRDVFSNVVPLIFRKEIYASACLVGALTFLLLEFLFGNVYLNISLSIVVVILIRYFAIKNQWSLPFNPLKSQ